MAVSGDDQTNLVACSIAKNLGYPRTIARVRDNRFLNRTRLDFARLFDIDYFIGPELLIANEIFKYMVSPGSQRVETFAHGAIQLRTIIVPQMWRKGNKPISSLEIPKGMMVALIYRRHHKGNRGEVIFPHGEDTIQPGDEVTLIGETEVINEAHHFFGVSASPIDSVFIIGGSRTAIHLTRILEQRQLDTRLVDWNYNRCCELSLQFRHATVINRDAADIDFLRSERVKDVDLVVVSTHSDEGNIMMALLAKEAGAENVIVQLSNTGYIPILNRLGIPHTPSPRVIAANRVLALVMSQTVSSMVALHEDEAEIMEIQVAHDAKVAGIPISDLGPLFPRDFLIAAIQNRGRVMIAHGERIISPGDSVIVVTHPRHLQELEDIF